MTKRAILLLGLAALLMATPAMAEDSGMPVGMDHPMTMHHAGMAGMTDSQDSRTSLGLPEPMRINQLAMMRGHLEAVSEIVSLIGEGKFDKASAIAHQRLGLTPEMQKMCSMFGNEKFRNLGFAFHKSADHLGDVLKTRDTSASLKALHSTMNYCISCHRTFRQ